MQPAYYEDFKEIKKKIWSTLNDAVTNRSSPFRTPVFICGDQSDFDGRIVVLRKSDQTRLIPVCQGVVQWLAHFVLDPEVNITVSKS